MWGRQKVDWKVYLLVDWKVYLLVDLMGVRWVDSKDWRREGQWVERMV